MPANSAPEVVNEIVFTVSTRKSHGKKKKTNLNSAPVKEITTVMLSLPVSSSEAAEVSVAPEVAPSVLPVPTSSPPLRSNDVSNEDEDDVVVLSGAVAATSQLDDQNVTSIVAASTLSVQAIPFFPSFAQQPNSFSQQGPTHAAQSDDRYYEQMTHQTHRAFQQNGHVVDDEYELDPEAYGAEDGDPNIFKYEDEELDSDQEEWLLEQMMLQDQRQQ